MTVTGYDDIPTHRLLSLAYNVTSLAIFEGLVAAGIEGIRQSFGNVMEHLAYEDGLRLNDLASRAGITPQSMGALVDELEELGYVERRPDPSDRRAKRIYMTAAGKQTSQVSWKVLMGINERFSELLGQNRHRALRRSLIEIIESLPPREEHG